MIVDYFHERIFKGEKMDINEKEIEERIKKYLDDILSKEDPDVLNIYKKFFKKYTPFSKRGYLSAYLLKNANFQNNTHKRSRYKMPDPHKTTLFVSVGRNIKVSPKDLVKLFQSRLDLEKNIEAKSLLLIMQKSEKTKKVLKNKV